MIVTDTDFGRALRTLQDYSENDESPLMFGVNYVEGDHLKHVVQKIWGTGKEAERAEQIVKELRAKTKEEKNKYFEERRIKRINEEKKEADELKKLSEK